MGEPEKEDGRLKFSYYKNAFQIIMKYSREGFAQVTKELINMRRQSLKDNKMDEYKVLMIEIEKRGDNYATEMVQ